MKITVKHFIYSIFVSCVLFNPVDLFAGCTGNDNINDNVTGERKGCKCSNSWSVGANHMVFSAFPQLSYCYSGGDDRWKSAGMRLCDGFTLDGYKNFNSSTMEHIAVFKNGQTSRNLTDRRAEAQCWKWGCKAGYAFKTDPATGNVNYAECQPCAAELTENGICMLPCDTTTTIDVDVNGVKKTVPANTRFGGKCMPTCNNKKSAIDQTDPTVFSVAL